jgi:hypothetical protein
VVIDVGGNDSDPASGSAGDRTALGHAVISVLKGGSNVITVAMNCLVHGAVIEI